MELHIDESLKTGTHGSFWRELEAEAPACAINCGAEYGLQDWDITVCRGEPDTDVADDEDVVHINPGLRTAIIGIIHDNGPFVGVEPPEGGMTDFEWFLRMGVFEPISHYLEVTQEALEDEAELYNVERNGPARPFKKYEVEEWNGAQRIRSEVVFATSPLVALREVVPEAFEAGWPYENYGDGDVELTDPVNYGHFYMTCEAI